MFKIKTLVFLLFVSVSCIQASELFKKHGFTPKEAAKRHEAHELCNRVCTEAGLSIKGIVFNRESYWSEVKDCICG